jgi:hypothetical protein
MRTLIPVLAILVTVPLAAPIAAQPVDAPTTCTEVMAGASIFIRHDCGEWASIMVVGTTVIRKPWSKANRASRTVRIRANREGANRPVEEPPHVPKPTRTLKPTPTPMPATGGTTMVGVDISNGNPDELDCPDFSYQEDAQELYEAQG